MMDAPTKTLFLAAIVALISVGILWESGTIQYRLGLRCLHGPIISEHKAMEWLSQASRKGNPKAMHQLRLIYSLNHFVEPDPIEAAKYFAAAAGRGHIGSLETLSKRAAEGEPHSQFRLAYLLHFKYEQYDRALNLYEQAAQKGHKEAAEWALSLQ